ncbi:MULTISPECIES: superoxide dismutase family protein [unclassified Janthinobacterium]|uniref:superoxide dismutase family protein n=1 Tax=unclassified Janthinobacterium TaxID=2610881 RepID=UPI0016138B6C|nr:MULTISPECIES: superoxide dismutase family protein [unclassified Janthinobacterium]MBB5610920.1 Cu-Zn family superoxide dismutase [Janthinobacterium sp. S3T4]MBB5616406.1 Cu-Zn family superoxide dismutase [Janthinobacterium sp. S3M3]
MKYISLILLSAAAVAIAGCATTPSVSTPGDLVADAVMKPTRDSEASGSVHFEQKDGRVWVTASIGGLSPGRHGFHIHEKGDCSSPDALSAGGHFNPTGTQHGNPASGAHHDGDFGNLEADMNGSAELKTSFPVSQISLDKGAANSIIGRGLIVHASEDDFRTQPTGNSGARLACGVIALK